MAGKTIAILGTTKYAVEVQVRPDGELSIVGEIRERGRIASVGQNVEEFAELPESALVNGFTGDDLTTLVENWERWHLNKMRAGSPAQEAWLREHPVTAVYPDSHYVKASEALAAAGLNPDPGHADYRYGSAWLAEELPESVREWAEGFHGKQVDKSFGR